MDQAKKRTPNFALAARFDEQVSNIIETKESTRHEKGRTWARVVKSREVYRDKKGLVAKYDNLKSS